jgi:quinoprotein glucose dehydrogenase
MRFLPLCRPLMDRLVRRSRLFIAASVGLPVLAAAEWPAYLGDAGASHYSAVHELTPGNVAQLRPVWTWNSGDMRGNKTQNQCNPLMVDGAIYVTTPGLAVAALDAATGRQRWRFESGQTAGLSRGLATWTDGNQRRLYFGAGRFLHAIDAATGRLAEDFGDGGRIDLSDNLGRDARGLNLFVNTPGVVFRDLIIMGMRVGEGPAPAAPGHIRAYDVRSGRLVWTFRTIPHPGEPGYETWPPDAWQRAGGANVWAGMTVDAERGMVFCPTGSASFDFWGGDRVGNNLYANCLLALDAATGRRIWHYQFVRHDLWDRDLPAPPTLVTVKRDGREIPAVAQPTKSGHVFVFHRETGEPLFPIVEDIAPSSDLVGEVTSPTQPRPLLPEPFARQVFTADEITRRTPEAHRAVLERFIRLRPHAPWVPPSKEGTVIFPGFDGAAEWGGAAADPDGVLYVNSNEMPWILTMIDVRDGGGSLGRHVYLQNCAGCHGPDQRGNAAANIPSLVDVGSRLSRDQIADVILRGRGVMPAWGFLSAKEHGAVVDFLRGEAEKDGTLVSLALPGAPATERREAGPPYTHTGYNRFLDPDGYPAVKPPWGTLNAIDLNTGEYRWRVPLGEYPELVAQGIPPTGTENYGGPVVTAGGLVIIAASRDEHIRAFDRRDGRELWRARLPAAGYATPAVYSIDGRPFVVITCGGGKSGTPSGDAFVAFSLPEGS